MRKLIIMLFVVFVVTIAGLPPVFGIFYERQFEAQINAGQPNPYMVFRIAEYQRGLYSSHATIAFSLSNEYVEQIQAAMLSSGPASPVTAEQRADLEEILVFLEGELRFNLDIRHGPWSFPDGQFTGLAEVTSILDSSAGALADLQQELGLPHLFAVDAQVSLDGSTDFQASIPPIEHGDTDSSITFSGLNMDGHYDNRDRRISVTSGIEILSIDNDKFGVRIAGVGLNTDSKLLENYLWLGTGNISIDEIVVFDPDIGEQSSVRITHAGMKATVDINEAGDKISMEADYFVGDISGIPEMAWSDLRFNLGLSEISLEAMYAYVEITRNMGFVSQDNAGAFLAEMQAIVFQVLSGSPSLSVDPFAFSVNGEPFVAQLRVDFDGAALPPGSTLDMLVGNPALWMSALSGKSHVETSEAMANLIAGNFVKARLSTSLGPESEVSVADIASLASAQSRMMIDNFVQQGMIKRSGGTLSSDISYHNGELIVNDTPFPLGGF